MGAAAVCFYAVHAGQYVVRRQPEHALWVCHLGALLVGIGVLTRQSSLNAIGTLWLIVGLPFWLYDLASGGEFVPTSVLTHVGGPVVGLIGARRLGVPTGLWWKVLVVLVPVCVASRLLTPPSSNVNLAHHVHPGFESVFPSYVLYGIALWTLFSVAALAFQATARRRGWKPPESP
jgi:hypothetical protein